MLPVAATEWADNAALCTVIKDSGDDPDVTNGCSVIARIELQAGQSPTPAFLFRAGEGRNGDASHAPRPRKLEDQPSTPLPAA